RSAPPPVRWAARTSATSTTRSATWRSPASPDSDDRPSHSQQGEPMDFAPSAAAAEYTEKMWDFMRSHVFPAEPVWAAYLREHGPHEHPPVMEELKAEARRRGLWNLFLPKLSGLSNVEYAAVAEISGWSPVIAPEAINCQAP